VSAFPFEVGFQRAILRLMMIDDAFAVKALEWVESGHFTSEPLGWMFETFVGYWKQYQQRTSDMVLREHLRKLPQDRASRYATEVEMVIALGVVPEEEYVRAQLADFTKQAMFAVAHQRSAELFNAGKRSEAYDTTMRALERIQTVGFDQVDRIWLFDELPERQRERIRRQLNPGYGAFTTGIPELDEATDGGAQFGQVWAIFAYAKRCKTTWLVNQLFHATRVHRQPTVYFNLEGSGGMIASRLDACFSLELYSKVKSGDIDPQRYSLLYQEYQSLRNLCVIRTLNDWDITILSLVQELQYLKSVYGFIPRMMVVDYMDLGRSRDRIPDGSETKHQLAFARDLKRHVNNNEVACWSAWQAHRPEKGAAQKKHVLRSSSVADAYAKVRVVDAYGSLNATDQEMREGKMRVFWEEHRDHPVNKLWEVTNDLARMRMLTSAVFVEPEDESAGGKSAFKDS
jgi:replicative DNA helicase